MMETTDLWNSCDPQKKKIGQKQLNIAGLKRAINAGSIFCRAQPRPFGSNFSVMSAQFD